MGSPTYDAHGNTTKLGSQTMSYDGADRHLATSASATITYGRDATDRITSRMEPRSTTRFGYSGAGDTSEYTMTAAGAVTERQVPLPGGVLLTKRAGGDVWSYPNVHGDVVATANASGVKQGPTLSYDPFGVALGALPDNSNGNFDYAWLGQHQAPPRTRHRPPTHDGDGSPPVRTHPGPVREVRCKPKSTPWRGVRTTTTTMPAATR